MLELLTYPFFQRALIGGIMIGIIAPLIGVFLVLRRLSMIGDTLAHVSIAGVALGFLLQFYPLGTGLLFALLGAFIIERLRRTYRGYAELSIAILLSAGIALASILFTLGRGFNMDVTAYLFGDILALDSTDLWLMFAVSAVVACCVLYFRKALFLLAMDEDAASVSGLPVSWLNMLVTVLTALVVSVAIKAVGALLVSALLTVPVACSLALGRGFRATLGFAVLFAETAIVTGLLVSGAWNLASGGTIVLLLIVMLVLLLSARKVWKW